MLLKYIKINSISSIFHNYIIKDTITNENILCKNKCNYKKSTNENQHLYRIRYIIIINLYLDILNNLVSNILYYIF